jgi:hypothetical protein
MTTPPPEPPSDGDDAEITNAASKEWIDELRWQGDDHITGDQITGDDVTNARTDVMEQIRDAVAATRGEGALPPPVTERIESVPVPRNDTPPVASGDRWAPPPRLRPATTPTTPPLVARPGSERGPTWIIIAGAIAAVVVVIGALIANRMGDAPPPDESVPGGTVPETTVATESTVPAGESTSTATSISVAATTTTPVATTAPTTTAPPATEPPPTEPPPTEPPPTEAPPVETVPPQP